LLVVLVVFLVGAGTGYFGHGPLGLRRFTAVLIGFCAFCAIGGLWFGALNLAVYFRPPLSDRRRRFQVNPPRTNVGKAAIYFLIPLMLSVTGAVVSGGFIFDVYRF
jgi:hypothetical protein